MALEGSVPSLFYLKTGGMAEVSKLQEGGGVDEDRNEGVLRVQIRVLIWFRGQRWVEED